MSYEITSQKFLTKDELAHMRTVIAKATPFNRILLNTLLYTGARATEVLNITFDDLSDSNRSVLIRGLKGSASRELPMPPRLYQEIKSLRLTPEQAKPFPITYKRLWQIWDEHCPVKGKGPHAARHTRGVQLYEKTKDIKLVALVLGHRSITNTQVYVSFVYNQAALRKLIL